MNTQQMSMTVCIARMMKVQENPQVHNKLKFTQIKITKIWMIARKKRTFQQTQNEFKRKKRT